MANWHRRRRVHRSEARRFDQPRHGKPLMVAKEQPMSVEYPVIGVLGRYRPDSDDDLCYGMYIEIAGHAVFIDIKEDNLLSQRIAFAEELAQHGPELQRSLAAFKLSHVEFANHSVDIIGLHNKDTRRGEVFWEPAGYTLLREFDFVNE